MAVSLHYASDAQHAPDLIFGCLNPLPLAHLPDSTLMVYHQWKALEFTRLDHLLQKPNY